MKSFPLPFPKSGLKRSASHRFSLLAALLSLLMGPGEFLVATAGDQPNVLVFLTDDQGWGDLSSSGNANLSTPNIDRLVAEGASFDRFFVCPVCSPTRAEFLTGRYHPRGGVYSTSAGGERLDLDERTIADLFRGAGYATGAFGKWHNGMQYPYHPLGRGFEEFYGFCSGHWGNYFSPLLEHNGDLVQGQGFVVDDFTERAMEFMTEAKGQGRPFFVYLPYNTPHSPMQVPERWWSRFKDHELPLRHREPGKENVEHSRAALAMCENVDWNVGRALDHLEGLGIAEETIVVYFCDNGPNGNRWNGGMKGRKGSTDEGGVRSPLIIRWPGKIAAGIEITQIAAGTDLLPTLAELAGVDVPAKPVLDGKSLAPLLKGEGYGWPDRLILSSWRDRVSARSQRFRLDHQGKLFDMRADPGQVRDVSEAFPGEHARLSEAVEAYRRDVLSELGEDERAFVIGHPGLEQTQVPARDAVTKGGLERSNRFPNCSFFRNWKTKEDRIEWEAEVAETGRFAVEMYYTCREGDEGSRLELSFGDATLEATIEEPHESPLRGGEHDRVKRVEGYVKDFRSMELGVIELQKGAGTLTLRALEIPGEEVAEFRLLMLRRLDS